MATSPKTPAGDPAWVEPMLAKPLTGQLSARPRWADEHKVNFGARFSLLAGRWAFAIR